ncbi:hypothetical protein HMPREF9554_02103 [Treponema phagedenis F0421]|nr:hypothetical protein HMPREF9554_02103 [Treponema phagedenis F0421]
MNNLRRDKVLPVKSVITEVSYIFYFVVEEKMKSFEKGKDKNITILGRETVFDGIMKFTENLSIRGKFTGIIDAQGALIVEKDAACKVQYARVVSAAIDGKFEGNITAVDRVEMRTGSVVSGNVTSSRIRIADDVDFEGSVQMLQDTINQNPDIFSIQSEQLKEKFRR